MSYFSVYAGYTQSAAFVLFQCVCRVCAECCICPVSVFRPGMRRMLVLSVSSVHVGYAQSASFVLFQCICGVCAECCICLVSVVTPVGAECWFCPFPVFMSGMRRVLYLSFSSVFVVWPESTATPVFQCVCQVVGEYLVCLFSVLLPDSRRVLFICFFSVSAVYPKSTDFVVF